MVSDSDCRHGGEESVMVARGTMDEGVKHEAASRGFREPACALVFSLLGGLFLFRLANFRIRWFNPDEFEHVHVSWCIANGMVPYRDFFEHHTPWLWYLLAPLVAGEELASDLGAAVRAQRVKYGRVQILGEKNVGSGRP